MGELFTLGSFSRNVIVAHIVQFRLCIIYLYIFAKNVLGYILSDFFTNSSEGSFLKEGWLGANITRSEFAPIQLSRSALLHTFSVGAKPV
jgi:hypothetical protein